VDFTHDISEIVDSDPVAEPVTVEEVEIISDQDATGSEAGLSDLTDPSAEDPAEALAKALNDHREAEHRAETAQQSYLRAVADLDNYRKRMRRELDNTSSRAAAKTVSSLLPVLDSFDAALGLDTSVTQDQNVLSGMKATYDLLLGTLQNQGLEVIDTAGQIFSPDVHEPINAPPEGGGEIIVANEVRRGYRLNGRLLRASLVMVSRRSETD
jgi:molecular chaperone GrpE